ncbi:MAG TPA: BlaI/MecI/CopY family transcriptional regulator [Candidatus Acidoferrales bacterium]|nr:BlaI/MecI/CopY family transcriptional regulator [Candidatus Acidoferrales bacterium]
MDFIGARTDERITDPAKSSRKLTALGTLECQVMDAVWTGGEGTVRDVSRILGRPLAYTTVMTTLERLFKKGLLQRRISGRAFLYSARFSREEWERQRAGEFIASFLAGPEPARDLLVSCFLEAAGRHDEKLLEDLENKVRLKRRDLLRKSKP